MADTDLSKTTDDAAPSKTQRKREAERLQALGRRLAELKPAKLTEIDLPTPLMDAIKDYQRFNARGAKRRQLQFIGRLMREIDVVPVVAFFSDLDGESARVQFEHGQAERWRERLLADASAHSATMTEFIDAYPHVDRQALRHAIQKAQREQSHDSDAKAHARALFRLLREAIEATAT